MMKGVYIHIPFCKTICSYCDFCKVFYDEKLAYLYLDALAKEIDEFYHGEVIDSIYIGGGTPSALSVTNLEKLFSLISKFNLCDKISFTFECNLNDICLEKLEILKKYGVNRLSIGIQSFRENKLGLLGRNHCFSEAQEKFKLMRSLGFNDINIDLIYALKGETKKDLINDLKDFIKLNPEHISTYSLMINDHTLLKLNKIESISEDIDALMYKIICKKLKSAGYNHYEVSNFAKSGYLSYHNLKYWHNLEYYGFGAGASGYLDKVRYSNTSNIFAYLKGRRRKEEILLVDKDIMDYEVMLNLRLLKGINTIEFKKKYGVELEDSYPVKPLLKSGELKQKKEYIYIPLDKIYVMNEILMKLV